MRGGGVYDRKSGRTVRRKSEQKSDRRQSVRGDASTIDKGRDVGTTTLPRAPRPPPDTAWKGPIPAGQGMSTTQAQLNALQQQQKMKLLMMQQHMKAKMSGQQKSSTGGSKMPPRENLDATKQNKTTTTVRVQPPDRGNDRIHQRRSPGCAKTTEEGEEEVEAVREREPNRRPQRRWAGRGRGGGRKRARR